MEAETLYRRALAIDEKNFGANHPRIALRLNNLGELLRTTNRFAEAEPLMRRALVIDEKSFGPNHPHVATALNNLALLFWATHRLEDAVALTRRALEINEKSLGPEHPTVATNLNNLAALLEDGTADYVESEHLKRRALTIDEKRLGPDHPDVGRDLNNLAELLRATNRLAEAEPLYGRVITIFQKTLGPDHPSLATVFNNLGLLLQASNRPAVAEPLMRRALAIDERSLGADDPNVVRDLNNLGDLLRISGQPAEAEPFLRRALAIAEKGHGTPTVHLAAILNNLASLLQDGGRLAEAEPIFRRVIQILQKGGAEKLPIYATALNNLAGVLAARGDAAGAVALHAEAKPILLARGNLQVSDRTGLSRTTLTSNTWAFRAHARDAHHANADDPAVRKEAFELAQWALQTDAAEALSQMSARFAKGEGFLAELIRERQNLIARRQGEDKRLLAAVGHSDVRAVEDIRGAIASLDNRLDTIDVQLSSQFQNYADLASPKPLSISETQTLLSENEVVVVFLDVPQLRADRLPEETLVWVVTRKEARWYSIPAALFDRIAALRCGLDETLWQSDVTAGKCEKILAASPHLETLNFADQEIEVRVLPFDLVGAHELYKELLGPTKDLIEGKHLMIVPSGPLTSIPFNVLVTEPPKKAIPDRVADYREAAWLGTRQPISVLPSVASLKALRQFAKISRATKSYLAVGNPLLDGLQSDEQWGPYYKAQAKAARDNEQCPNPTAQHVGSARGGSKVANFSSIFRGTHADIESVRLLTPLPETADELCEVGRYLGAPQSEILLGSRATETALKALSDSGRLSDYGILHFATHGALTGQVQGSAEPGLILTPPPTGTSDPSALERDDGFLTASEIATLKLDADWVVLSACNTAAGNDERAEALSGMARAFFYAGARALLVTHWEVGSHAAVKLTTRAFAALKSDPAIGRSEALRISMRDLINKGSPIEAHPSQWAPFVVVGEGGVMAHAANDQMLPKVVVPPISTPSKIAKTHKNSQTPKMPDWRSRIWRQ
jgi:CHAT domain-containing protein/tetratricopeptide (TPR) repeat protein